MAWPFENGITKPTRLIISSSIFSSFSIKEKVYCELFLLLFFSFLFFFFVFQVKTKPFTNILKCQILKKTTTTNTFTNEFWKENKVLTSFFLTPFQRNNIRRYRCNYSWQVFSLNFIFQNLLFFVLLFIWPFLTFLSK